MREIRSGDSDAFVPAHSVAADAGLCSEELATAGEERGVGRRRGFLLPTPIGEEIAVEFSVSGAGGTGELRAGRGCDAGEARESAVGNLPRASPISASNRAARTVPERGRLVTTARSGCTRSCSAIRSARVWIWLARVRSTAT